MSNSFEVHGVRLFRPNSVKTKKRQEEHEELVKKLEEDVKEFYSIPEDTLNKRFTI
ncbi:MAG: hypothetical protein ACTSVL_06760 [Promethearchaeota archaeon]